MKNFDEMQTLVARADRLIRLQATGTAREFAATLGISRASLFRLLEFFKSHEVSIKYCKYRRTYYYENPVKIEMVLRQVDLVVSQKL